MNVYQGDGKFGERKVLLMIPNIRAQLLKHSGGDVMDWACMVSSLMISRIMDGFRKCGVYDPDLNTWI